MEALVHKPTRSLQLDEPTWDIAYLFPRQGQWTIAEYLELEGRNNRHIEFSAGRIEILPMPTALHQIFLQNLYRLLFEYVRKHLKGARLLVAPHPVRLSGEQFFEPDILLLLPNHLDRAYDQFTDTPDLVVEIVSAGNRKHDLVTKRAVYAEAGIVEYWIVDPQAKSITVLMLSSSQYDEHGVFLKGEIVTSSLLSGFAVAVDDILNTDPEF